MYGTNLHSGFRTRTEQCNKPEDLCPYKTRLFPNYNRSAFSIITFHINPLSCGPVASMLPNICATVCRVCLLHLLFSVTSFQIYRFTRSSLFPLSWVSVLLPPLLRQTCFLADSPWLLFLIFQCYITVTGQSPWFFSSHFCFSLWQANRK